MPPDGSQNQQFSAINSRMVKWPDCAFVIVKGRTVLLKALQRRSVTEPSVARLRYGSRLARDNEAKKNSFRSIL